MPKPRERADTEWRGLPGIDKAQYRKTSTYAFRRLGKALRNLGRAILQEPPVSWLVRIIK